MKTCTSAELLIAAERVSAGKIYMSDALSQEFANNLWEGNTALPHDGLSERESLVVAMLVSGWTVTAIGASLHLSVKTISTHKTRAMAKLKCKTLSELIQYAIAHDMMSACETMCLGRKSEQ